MSGERHENLYLGQNSHAGRYFDKVNDVGEIYESIEPSENINNRLEESTVNYLVEVSKILEANDFQDEEDKELFITNVFKSMEGEETKVPFNKKASKVLESFLSVCSERQVLSYAKIVEDSIESFCIHRYASHVLQTLLQACLRLVSNRSGDRNKVEEEELEYTVEQFVKTVVDHLCSNLYEMITNEHASHVICSAIEVLSGHKVDSFVGKNRGSHHKVSKDCVEDNDGVTVPKEFTILFFTLVEAAIEIDDFERKV